MNRKESVYLDMNIYDKIVKFEDERNKIVPLIDRYEYFYSGAHGEELYNARCKSKGKHNVLISSRIATIEFFTKCKKICPTMRAGLVVEIEKFEECCRRIERDDTREKIRDRAKIHFDNDKEFIEKEKNEKHELMNLSNLDEYKIWEESNIINSIETWNKLSKCVIKQYNSSADNLEIKNKYGVSIHIPEDLTIHRGMFEKIKKNFHALEFVIENLSNILSQNGYKFDSKFPKFYSGIYDVTHSICATYCDNFVTNDSNFRDRCKAIYAYMGISTNVISFEEFICK